MNDKEELTMTDYAGNPVKVGDYVVYIRKTYCTACLAKGTVSKIVNMFGKKRAYINGAYHTVESQSIYKL